MSQIAWLILPFFFAKKVEALIISQEGEAYQPSYGLSSGMLPRLPSGQALQLLTSPRSGILGTTVWPGASALCSFLANRYSLKGKHCVDLGGRRIIKKLYAAALGAQSVMLTDCRPPPDAALYTTDGSPQLPEFGSSAILELLEQNAQANRKLYPPDTDVRVTELDWTNESHRQQVASRGPNDGFDVVLASDVTHFSQMHEPLADTIAHLLGETGGECIVSHQERMVTLGGQDMQLGGFVGTAMASGLEVDFLAVPSEEGNGSMNLNFDQSSTASPSQRITLLRLQLS